jgi:integrase
MEASWSHLNLQRSSAVDLVHMAQMGHATIDMTMRYAHLSPDTRREAVGVLDRPFAPACDIRATRMEEAANHP